MVQRPYLFCLGQGASRRTCHCLRGICAFTGTGGAVERCPVGSGAAIAELRTDIGVAKQGQRLTTVFPRSGTISPWSSKASDIFSRCGLDSVHRVERGVRWFASEEPTFPLWI